MSEYKRLVAYIYLYDRGKRVKNIGFTKAESKNGECRILVHIKGAWLTEDSDCEAYIFYRQRERLKGIRIGTLSLTNGAGELKIVTEAASIMGSKLSLSDMAGIVIRVNDGHIFATRWDDGPVDFERFACDEPDVQAAEIADLEMPTESQPEVSMALPEERAEDFRTAEPADLLDFGEPGRRLINNSFLLHGYYNYGHLLIICDRENGHRYLGVPGDFSMQERMMASLFGFPEFQNIETFERKQGNTGYWLRRIEYGPTGKIYESSYRAGEESI